jgi:hypothetical protein
VLRRKEWNPDQFEIEKKLKIKRKGANNLENESIFPLQGKTSNFDVGGVQ